MPFCAARACLFIAILKRVWLAWPKPHIKSLMRFEPTATDGSFEPIPAFGPVLAMLRCIFPKTAIGFGYGLPTANSRNVAKEGVAEWVTNIRSEPKITDAAIHTKARFC